MEIIDALSSSGQRRTILNVLYRSPKSLKEIGEVTGISIPIISRQLKKLSELGLVVKDGNQYQLTDKGEIVKLALSKFMKIIETLERDPEYWEVHDFSAIPDEFKLRLDELGNYEVLRSGKNEVLKHYRVFSSIYTRSKVVRLISSVFFPQHPQMFVEIASRADVEVILPLKSIKALEKDYSGELKQYFDNGGKMYRHDWIKFTVITTEKALCIGLFMRNGKYDTESGLLSLDETAIKWGFDLFEYFKKSATPYP
jgi:predicted transcriptional regulator